VTRRLRGAGGLVIGTLVAAACSSASQQAIQFDEPGSSPGSTDVVADAGTTSVASTDVPSTEPSAEGALAVRIDVTAPGQDISPLILGVSSTLTAEEMTDAGIQLNSWGGNPSSRYNYVNGHAWNNGSDYEFRNTNFGDSGDALRHFLDVSATAGVESRVAVPTLGWVARNDDQATCSFPVGDHCLSATDVGDCTGDGPVADPKTANVESTPEMVADWIGGVVGEGHGPRFIAMDNEPELWGVTHYDVHPDCPTYEEILDKYLSYATAIREAAPDAELTGPVMCCWYDYWDIAPGPADGSGEDYLTWFLRNVRAHDEDYGKRTLDVVDVHYYPQSDVYNDKTDPETSARRLRSTRSLWDPHYADESWIEAPIELIPRLERTIEATYPDTPLFISEWNFGADTSMNGALAIADALGIYGREGVYAAAYWRNPPVGSPGWFAFKMHGNYDDRGSRFGGRVVPAEVAAVDQISAYAALDDTVGRLRVMLINKDPENDLDVPLEIDGFDPLSTIHEFTYSPAEPSRIVADVHEGPPVFTLPASSITVLELDQA
jgi:Glycoside hydrolase family 44